MMKIEIHPKFRLSCPYCNRSFSNLQVWDSSFIVTCPNGKCGKESHLFVKLTKDFVDSKVPIVGI